MSWTDERIGVLKKMWKAGNSAADIAKELGGVTRNAVIGKAHRMGLSGRPSPIKKSADKAKTKTATAKTKTTAAKPKAVKEKKPSAKTKKELASKAAKNKKPTVLKSSKTNQLDKELMETIKQESETRPVSGGVALIDLTERMCKWPFGDPQEDDFIFCGEAIHAGTPYCPNHAIMAYQTSARSRAAAKARNAAIEAEDEIDDLEIVDDDVDDVDEDKVGSVD